MKKKFLLLLVIVLVCAIASTLLACGGNEQSDDADQGDESVSGSQGLEFRKVIDGYMVSGYNGSDTDVVIPSTYKKEKVSEISDNAFKNNMNITSVSIPGSVVRIWDDAFRDCKKLASVGFGGDGLESIETRAFYGCEALTSVALPNSVTSIQEGAFEKCSALASVSFGDQLQELGVRAFALCGALTEISLPASLKTIANRDSDQPFLGCTALESIKVAEGNSVYHDDNNCLIETESKRLQVGCKSSVIPSDGSVTIIDGGAFRVCEGLTEIVIPEGIETIEYYAFAGCLNLTEIVIPNSVKRIAQKAFLECTELSKVTLGNGIKELGAEVFWSCEKLTDVNYVGTKNDMIKVLRESSRTWYYIGNGYIETIECSDGTMRAHD